LCAIYHGKTFIPTKKLGLFEPNFKLELFFSHGPNKTKYSNVRQQISPIGKYNVSQAHFTIGIKAKVKLKPKHVIFPNRINLVAIKKISPKSFTPRVKVEK
jgi:hypothetical protein